MAKRTRDEKGSGRRKGTQAGPKRGETRPAGGPADAAEGAARRGGEDVPPFPPARAGEHEDPFAWGPGGETDEEIGESASESLTAPASEGMPHAEDAVLDEEDILDTQGKRGRRVKPGETAVPSPSGGASSGPRVQSGSAGAASTSAGSAPPEVGEQGSEDREVLGGIGDEKHGGKLPDR